MCTAQSLVNLVQAGGGQGTGSEFINEQVSTDMLPGFFHVQENHIEQNINHSRVFLYTLKCV